MEKNLKSTSEIYEFLEDLPTRRFTTNSLENELNTFFEYESTLDIDTELEDSDTDFRFLYSVPYEHLNVDIDIYFLKMRTEGFDGSTYYITETSFAIQ